MELLKSLTQWLEIYAPWLDVLALFLVGVIAIRKSNLIGFIVLIEFAFSLLAIGHVRLLPIWPNVDMDYQYVLGIKDVLMAVILFLLAANPLLTLSYLTGSIACLFVWYGYVLVYDYVVSYDVWLVWFYAWSPAYFVVMCVEIVTLSIGEGDAGKRIRSKVIPFGWGRIFRPVHRALYCDITGLVQRTSKVYR